MFFNWIAVPWMRFVPGGPPTLDSSMIRAQPYADASPSRRECYTKASNQCHRRENKHDIRRGLLCTKVGQALVSRAHAEVQT